MAERLHHVSTGAGDYAHKEELIDQLMIGIESLSQDDNKQKLTGRCHDQDISRPDNHRRRGGYRNLDR
jgi:hypothetical protein